MSLTALLIIGLGCMVGYGMACTCPLEPFTQLLCRADAVIQAVVTNKSELIVHPTTRQFAESLPEEDREIYMRMWGYHLYTLDIQEAYGTTIPGLAQALPNTLKISTASSMCGMILDNGARYILSVHEDGSGTILTTNGCAATIDLDSPDSVPLFVQNLDCSNVVNPWELNGGRRRALALAREQAEIQRNEPAEQPNRERMARYFPFVGRKTVDRK